MLDLEELVRLNPEPLLLVRLREVPLLLVRLMT